MPYIKPEELFVRASKSFNTEERNNINSIWSDIGDYITPSQSGHYNNEQTSKGTSKHDKIYDITAIQANRDLASAIQSTVTNPATQWAKIKFSPNELNDIEENSFWLEDTSRKVHKYLNESNFNAQVSKAFQTYCSIGTMVLLVEELYKYGKFQGLYFKAVHMSEIAIEENNLGIVDTVFRKYKLTGKQMYDKYKDILPTDYFNDIETDTIVELIHAVYPNQEDKIDTKNIKTVADRRAFISVLFECKSGKVLEKDGYHEMPYLAVRWETLENEVYGRSPSYRALPIVKMLNKLQQLTIKMVERAVIPPMLVQNYSLLGKLNLSAGKINVVKDLNGIRELLTGARIDLGQFKIDDMQKTIKEVYFLDKLLLPPRQETGEMTAFEVQQRLEQMQKVLGSVLGNINNELLSPLVLRVMGILKRNNVLNDLPMEEVDIQLRFENSLARSQRNEDVTNILQWIQYLGQIAQFKPEVLDLVNGDEIVKHIADIRNVPEIIINSDAQVAQTREQRQQQQQMQQQMDMAVKGADIQAKSGGGNNEEQ